MDKLNLRTFVLLGLLLAALISLFFALKYGVRPANPVPPAAPAAAVPQAVKAPVLPVSGAAAGKRRRAKKPEVKRYKRVSTLRDPGEALIGGVSRDTAPATSGAAAKGR